MRSIVISIIFSAVLLIAGVSAADSGVVTLTDGTVIRGEIISLNNGIYKIKTDSLGILEVDEKKIRSVNFAPETPSGSHSGDTQSSDYASQLRALQSMMLNDEATADLVFSLQNDPDMQDVLNDPEIMEAINTGNFNYLFGNPKIQRLMDNANVQQIQRNIGK